MSYLYLMRHLSLLDFKCEWLVPHRLGMRKYWVVTHLLIVLGSVWEFGGKGELWVDEIRGRNREIFQKKLKVFFCRK